MLTFYKRRGDWRLLLLIALAALLLLASLAGCMLQSLHGVLTINADGWELVEELVIPAQVLAMMEVAEVDETAQGYVDEARGQGLEAQWERCNASEGLCYRIIFKGKGLESLSAIDVSATPINYQGKQAWRLYISDPSAGMGEAMEYSFAIEAGKVLASNGRETGSGKVMWTDATISPEAIIVPKAGAAGLLWPLLIVIAVAAVVVGVLSPPGRALLSKLTAREPGRPTAPPARPGSESGKIMCGNCGQENSAWARKCKRCRSPLGDR